MKVYLHFLGCRLNQSEIESMAGRFAAGGHAIVSDPAQADLCVVNTCTVTGEAGRKSRQAVRRIHRATPQAAITVTGCYSQLAPERAARLPGVTEVVPNAEKDGIGGAGLVEAAPVVAPGTVGRTRAFIKAQDGCDNRCTFCVTTLARGAATSRPQAEVVEVVNAFAAAGYHEAVLTGVHLGAHDDLYGLVRAVLAHSDIARVRLSSLEPWDIPAGFFRLWEDPRLCRHLHLPLQSGCAATLKRMARRTRPDDFAALVAEARAHIPELAISTDIIAGFPGESEAEFAESLAFTRRMDFMKLHVFRYSARPGTAAARMPGQVDNPIKRARSARMQALSEEGARRYAARFVGRVMPVLWEQAAPDEDGYFLNNGLTDNYLRVTLRAPRPLENTIIPVRLVAQEAGTLRGEMPH